MAKQTCKDCGGAGVIFGRREDWCETCDAMGTINRTGPYRLADGTWSDGIDRRLELARRDTTQNRWEVWQDAWGDWVAYRFDGETTNYECDEYPTHTEAIAYADKQARTTMNGETK